MESPAREEEKPASAEISKEAETAWIAAAQRDPAAFDRIYRLYVTPVFRYLCSRTGQPLDAEDLTAQVFTEALEGLPRYRTGGCFAAWLFTIARRRAIDHLRRRKPEAELTEQIRSDDAGSDPMAEAVRREESRRLRNLLGALGDGDRELLRLRFAGGLRLAEIARIIGRSEAAVKMSLRRLLQRLELQWEKRDE